MRYGKGSHPSAFFISSREKSNRSLLSVLNSSVPSFFKIFSYPYKKLMRRQSPLRMAVLRPRIREVEVNAVHFAFCEYFRKLARVLRMKTGFKFCFLIFHVSVPRAEQYAVVHLNTNVVDLSPDAEPPYPSGSVLFPFQPQYESVFISKPQPTVPGSSPAPAQRTDREAITSFDPLIFLRRICVKFLS